MCPVNTRWRLGALCLSSLSLCMSLNVNLTVQVTPNMTQAQFVVNLNTQPEYVLISAGEASQVFSYPTVCPSGYYCPTKESMPTPCPAGTVNPDPGATNLTQCLSCPIGAVCPVASTIPLNCTEGTFRDLLNGKELNTDCFQCYSGSYCLNGSSLPTPCPAGTFLPYGGAPSIFSCAPCPAGYWCGVNTSIPTMCAPGTFRNQTGGQAPGACNQCVLGSYCPTGSTLPTLCPSGTYSANFGASLCGTCLIGHVCAPGTSDPTPCSPGTFRPTTGGETQTDCSTCTLGHYCVGGDAIPCPLGDFQNDTGTSSCNTCTAGEFQHTPGMNFCETCGAGKYQTGTGMTDTGDCLTCSAGTFQTGYGMTLPTDCKNCDIGFYCADGATQVSCPNSSSSNSGAVSILSCVCNPGYRGVNGGQCTICNQTAWCWAGRSNLCPSHSMAMSMGASSQAECMCLAGYFGFAMNPNGIPCAICQQDSYCTGGAANRTTTCPYGEYSADGAIDVSGCYCPGNATSGPGATNLDHCTCVPSFKRVTDISTHAGWKCAKCGANEVCFNDTSMGCPPYSHSATAVTDYTQCTCNAGYYHGGDTTYTAWCSPCDSNYFCVGDSTRQACNALMVAPPQSVAVSACYCVDGYVGTGAATCSVCSANKYCTLGATITCPANTVSLAQSTNLTNCLCVPGYSGPAGGACTACQAGNYTVSIGKTSCDLCPIGTGSAGVAKLSCPLCPPGTYQDTPGSSACKLCGLGTYQTGSGLTAAGDCSLCDTGTYQTGSGMSISTNCSMCIAGTFQTGLGRQVSSSCLNCSAGSYSLKGFSVCTPCPAGQFMAATAASACGNCPYAQYSSSGASVCTLCPFASNTLAVASVSSSQCLCNPGYFGNCSDITGVPGGMSYYRFLSSSNLLDDSSMGMPLTTVGGTVSYSSDTPSTQSNGSVITSGGAYLKSPSFVSTTGNASFCTWFKHPITIDYRYYYTFGPLDSGTNFVALVRYSGWQFLSLGASGINYIATAVTAGQWIHTCHVVSGSTQTVYRNGAYVGQIGMASSWQNSQIGVYLGFGPASVSVNSQFSDTMVFNTALTAAQVLATLNLQWWAQFNINCKFCSVNSFCTGGAVNLQTTCPNNTYSLAQSSNVGQCVCPAYATWLIGSNCTCNPGYYMVLNTAALIGGWQCTPCPIGSYCYLGVNTTCPVNTTSPAMSVYASSCVCVSAYVFYQNTPIPLCQICAAGDYCKNNYTETQCGMGQYSTAGATVCSLCAAGNYTALNATTMCAMCSPGTYQSGIGMSVCMSCSAGSYTPGSGASVCATCTTGNFCLAGSSVPTQCALGTYRATTGAQSQSQCSTCTPGNYCLGGGAVATGCFPGTYQTAVGLTDPTQCLYCGMGQYTTGLGYTACMNCSAGYYQTGTGLGAINSCVACAAGTFSTAIAATDPSTCILCALGTYSRSGMKDCTGCPVYSNTTSQGQTAITNCTCQASYTLPTPIRDLAVNCGSGANPSCLVSNLGGAWTMAPTTAFVADSGGAYTTAFPMLVQVDLGAVYLLTSIQYMPGQCWTKAMGCYNYDRSNNIRFSTGLTTSNLNACFNTGVLSTNPGFTLTSFVSCNGYARYVSIYAASPGDGTWTSISNIGILTGDQCSLCASNYYCPGLNLSNPCPNSTYSYPGAITVDKCICPANTAWLQGTNCTCNQGYYKFVNVSAPLGSASSVPIVGWQCNPCAPGTYGSAAGVCTACGTGTYQTGTGMTKISDCTNCTIGTYAPSTGSTTCTQCQTNSSTIQVGAASTDQCLCKAGLNPVWPCLQSLIAQYQFLPSGFLQDTTGLSGSLVPTGTSPYYSADIIQSGITSAQFDGTASAQFDPNGNGYLALPSINYAQTGSFSICFWLKPENNVNVYEIYFAAGAVGQPHGVGSILVQASTNSRYIEFSTNVNGWSPILTIPGPWNTWTHYCMIQSSTTFSLYNNGIFFGSFTKSFPSLSVTGFLGANNPLGWNDGKYRGKMSDFRIYNSELTVVQIKCIFEGCNWHLCTGCSSNSYCPGFPLANPITCPNSTYSYSGAITVDQCICPANSTWLSGTNCTCLPGLVKVMNASAPLGGWQCSDCPPGVACLNNVKTNCAPGTYQPNVDSSTCLLCSAGYYQSGTGMTTCSLCGSGTYATGSGTTSAAACPSCSTGTYSTGSGMTTPDMCAQCAAGTYGSSSGATVCTNCPVNSNSSLMRSSRTQCYCNPGFTGPLASAAATLTFTFDTRSQTGATGPDGSVPYTIMPLGSIVVSSGTTAVKGQTIPRGIQIWTVGVTGVYNLVAAGAAVTLGGLGKGIVVSTQVSLTAGDVILVMVGQRSSGTSDGCGAGGTFVTKFSGSGLFSTASSHTVLLAAGGGGAGGRWGGGSGGGSPGVATTSGGVCGSAISATNGGGGGSYCQNGGNPAISLYPLGTDGSNSGGGGGGFSQNGAGVFNNNGIGSANSFLNGGSGVWDWDSYSGFGGGGASWGAGGAGGGYSGGTGGGANGGGGGSYDINGVGYNTVQYTSWSAATFGTVIGTYSAGLNSGEGFVVASTLAGCSICAANSYCAAAFGNVSTTCPNATYSYLGAGSVSQCVCPANAIWQSGSNCICQPGYYKVVNALAPLTNWQCNVCAPGSACFNNVQSTCIAGSYSFGGTSLCTQCGVGTYQTGLGSSQPCTSQCAAGTYQSATGATICGQCAAGSYILVSGSTGCNVCDFGSYQSASGASQPCTLCPIYSNTTNTSSTNPSQCICYPGFTRVGDFCVCGTGWYYSNGVCSPCPKGYYCVAALATPQPCPSGTYNPITAANSSSQCLPCPAGSFCGAAVSFTTPCPAGTFLETQGGVTVNDCMHCQPGTFSLATGLTTLCPVCPANSFCQTPTQQNPCPAHTTSGNGSFSLLQCHCTGGHVCMYAKKISLVVTLNVTVSDFKGDIGGVQTNFTQAILAAAGVQTSHPVVVTINNVAAIPSGRRLLSDEDGGIKVYATVTGVVRLRQLRHHLSTRLQSTHISHTMQHEHMVHVVHTHHGASEL